MLSSPTISQDIEFVKSALPDHYRVGVTHKPGTIRCRSEIGIRQEIDNEDDEHWSYVMKAFKKYFADRFRMVDHNTCFCHTDFVIILK